MAWITDRNSSRALVVEDLRSRHRSATLPGSIGARLSSGAPPAPSGRRRPEPRRLRGHQLANRLLGRAVLEPHHDEAHVERSGEPLQRLH